MERNKIFKKCLAGFTLTELMAVSIIVAILAGLATGSYRKAIERSRVTEGHVAAKTLASALDRYYMENPTLSYEERTFPTIAKLDIGFDNEQPCNPVDARCVRTRYFQLKIKRKATNSREVYVTAERLHTNNQTMGYELVSYPTMFGGQPHKYIEPECIFSSEKGKDLCISFGYPHCTDGNRCWK